MVIFDFDKVDFSNSKACIRIDIRKPFTRVEYNSLTEAADAIVNNVSTIRICCNKNRGLRTPKYRVKDWFFIYKED